MDQDAFGEALDDGAIPPLALPQGFVRVGLLGDIPDDAQHFVAIRPHEPSLVPADLPPIDDRNTRVRTSPFANSRIAHDRERGQHA